MEKQGELIPFDSKPIRKIWYNEEWWFSVVDTIEILTNSSQPSRYWADLKKRTNKEVGQSFAFCERLKLPKAVIVCSSGFILRPA